MAGVGSVGGVRALRGFMENRYYIKSDIQKTAAVGEIIGAASKAAGVVWDFTKAAASGLLTAGAFGLAGAAAVGGGIGYLAARTSSPDIATSTAEQDVAQEALETEIDIVKRQIAQLERKKAAAKKAKKEKVYDRFVV